MRSSNRYLFSFLVMVISLVMIAQRSIAGEFDLTLRTIKSATTGKLEFRLEEQTWDAKKTAVIVCDTWDYHHSLNAVRRLEHFAPRMNQVISEARRRGAVIIHAPSDCMPSYADHPARRRAIENPVAPNSPLDVATWCSKIPQEETATYPIDQSDGGDDDDPKEHAVWSDKLKALGRNPALPWQKQSDVIAIDSLHDFISDRGDEVWNILTEHHIQQIILVGVHTNMCVLGRPFGLRQMARNGMKVVLMRDMTDCMYNPKCWPYVDHFTGNDLVINHVERFVCPTITSNQILGGTAFRFQEDKRAGDQPVLLASSNMPTRIDLERQWTLASIPNNWTKITSGLISEHRSIAWYRCAIRFPKNEAASNRCLVHIPCRQESVSAWLNGQPLVLSSTQPSSGQLSFEVPFESIFADEANLLVLRIDHRKTDALNESPRMTAGALNVELKGRWQLRLGDNESWSNIPLPAKFGTPPDIYYELR